MLRVLS